MNLPKGQLKGSIDDNTFVLTVGAQELADYIDHEGGSNIFQKEINVRGNDYIVLFSIEYK
ncbi:hypothetical protein KUV50_09930 [Membranicola marinus]|uniref:Uncharacterized protein n=1 Tax=Membranihabitans marinus TaxID=1227546 RepID=A0A953LBD5_9BACT|nr:hypothetical protein [Membranihabitans marinus]MBY5958451.1 hypothetical protein [Membranihabitans marinus]